MLILKQPLQCKTLSPLSMLSDMFEEKITGNYKLMSADIRKEELLHMVSMPPEIYIGQDGMPGISTENNIRNNHTVNVSVINNLLNRILLYDVKRFTYQDSVYVTAILNRLGIHDVKEFMKQVRELREETESIETLTELYENNSDRLRELFLLLGERKKTGGQSPETITEKQPAYYLHHAVYTRLDTGNIYRTMAAYSRNQATEEYEITKNELLSAEALKVSREITWNQTKNNVSGREMPLFFYHLNRYELENSEQTEITEDTMLSQLNAAVLLHIADNLYTLRSRQIHKGPENSFMITDALYQSGESTIRRFEEYHKNQMVFNESAQQYISDVNQAYQEEIKLITNMFGIMPAGRIEQKNYGGEYTAEHWQVHGSYSSLSEPQRNENYENLLQLQYVNEQDLSEWNEEQKAEYYQNIRQQLDRVNEQNLLMRDRVQKLEERTPVYRKIAVDREKAKKDSLRALENPEEVLLEYMTDTTELERVENNTRDQMFELFSDETKEIYEKLLHYRENAGQYAQIEGLPAEEQKHILQEMVLTEQAEKAEQAEQEKKETSDYGEMKEAESYKRPSAKNLYQILQHIEKSMETTNHASEYKTKLYELSEEIWPEEKDAFISYFDISGEGREKLSAETIERLEKRLTQWEKGEKGAAQKIESLFSTETREAYEKLLIYREEQQEQLMNVLSEEEKAFIREELVKSQGTGAQQSKEAERLRGEMKEAESYKRPSVKNLYQILQHIEKSVETTNHTSEYKTKLYELSEEIWPEEKDAFISYFDISGEGREKLSAETIERLEKRLTQWEKGEKRAAQKIESLFSTETREAYEKLLTYREEQQEQLMNVLSEEEKTFIREELVKSQRTGAQQSKETERFMERVELVMKQPQLWKQAAEYFYNNPAEHIQQDFVLTKLRQEELWEEAETEMYVTQGTAPSEHRGQPERRSAASRFTEKWLEPAESSEVRYHQDLRQTWTGKEMIYKNTETELDEELLQSLMTERRLHEQALDITENTTEESRISQTQVKETTRQTVIQNTEDITEMVNQGVRRQLGMISEQVFNRLEKKLASERKRRGF